MLCKHEVVGSIPSGSTKVWARGLDEVSSRLKLLLSFPMRFISFVERESAWRDEGRMAGDEDFCPPPFLPVLDL